MSPRKLTLRRYSRQFTVRATQAQRRAVLLSSAQLLEQVEIYLVQLGFSLQQYKEVPDSQLRLQHLLEAESDAEIMTTLLGVLRNRKLPLEKGESMSVTAEALEPEADPYERVREIALMYLNNVGTQYHTGILAVEIRDHIQDTDPGLLDAWDRTMEIDALKTILAHFRTSQRRRTGAFRGSQSAFDRMLEVDATHTQRRMGDLVRHEVQYIVRQYRKRARTMNRRASALNDLLQRFPDETTTLREVVTEEELAVIFVPGDSD